MKISLNWVKQLTTIEIEEEELIRRIAAQIAEIESIERLGEKYKDIVVADVVSVEKHPDADKLKVFLVDNGSDENVQVVGGGGLPITAGDKVAHLPPGCIVPSSFWYRRAIYSGCA